MVTQSTSQCCTTKDKTIQSLKKELKHRDDVVMQEVKYKISERDKINKARNILVDTKFLQDFDEKTLKSFKEIFGLI
jgi:uncharacterized protein (DUF3084 family)